MTKIEVTPDYNVVTTVNGYSFSHMQVYNFTHLYIKQIGVENGSISFVLHINYFVYVIEIEDSFWIIRDSSQPPFSHLEKFILLEYPQVVCDWVVDALKIWQIF